MTSHGQDRLGDNRTPGKTIFMDEWKKETKKNSLKCKRRASAIQFTETK